MSLIYLSNDIVETNHFNSITDFFEYEIPANHRNRNRFIEYTDNRYLSSERKSKLGRTNNSNTDVINHALLGDHEMFKILDRMVNQLKDSIGKNKMSYRQQVEVTKRKVVHRSMGDELDIHKVYQGNLEKAWRTTERQSMDIEHNLITLFIDIGGNWNENPEDSLWQAAVSVLLVDDLVKAGKTVKIMVGAGIMSLFTSSNKRNKYASWSITVKNYNEQLTLERLAAMTHLGFFRVFGFGMITLFNDRISGGLGIYSDISRDVKRLPINLQHEIDRGHTRIVFVKKARNLNSARYSLSECYSQIDKFAKGE